jgi:flagellar biosynthetic protein FliP
MNPLMSVVNEGPSTMAAVRLVTLFTVLSFLPALILCATSFTRAIIVLSFLRQSIGAPTLPPNPVLIALSLAITFFVMGDTAAEAWQNGVSPYLDGQLEQVAAAERTYEPFRVFMTQQVRRAELDVMLEAAHLPVDLALEDLPARVLLPAYLLSELTTSFTIGMYVMVPFLLIDLMVATLLMSMGMAMVPPTVVALPLKVAVFVLADGWTLVVRGLIASFGV